MMRQAGGDHKEFLTEFVRIEYKCGFSPTYMDTLRGTIVDTPEMGEAALALAKAEGSSQKRFYLKDLHAATTDRTAKLDPQSMGVRLNRHLNLSQLLKLTPNKYGQAFLWGNPNMELIWRPHSSIEIERVNAQTETTIISTSLIGTPCIDENILQTFPDRALLQFVGGFTNHWITEPLMMTATHLLLHSRDPSINQTVRALSTRFPLITDETVKLSLAAELLLHTGPYNAALISRQQQRKLLALATHDPEIQTIADRYVTELLCMALESRSDIPRLQELTSL